MRQRGNTQRSNALYLRQGNKALVILLIPRQFSLRIWMIYTYTQTDTCIYNMSVTLKKDKFIYVYFILFL